MFKSAFWAFISVICMTVALVYLMLAGFYLSKSPDPAIAYLGLFLQFLGGAVICGIIFQILHTHETRTLLNKSINSVREARKP